MLYVLYSQVRLLVCDVLRLNLVYVLLFTFNLLILTGQVPHSVREGQPGGGGLSGHTTPQTDHRWADSMESFR